MCVVVQTKINIHDGRRSASSPPGKQPPVVLCVHTRGRKRGERDATRLPFLTSSPFLKRAVAHPPVSSIPSIERNPWSVRAVVVCHQPLARRLPPTSPELQRPRRATSFPLASQTTHRPSRPVSDRPTRGSSHVCAAAEGMVLWRWLHVVRSVCVHGWDGLLVLRRRKALRLLSPARRAAALRGR